MSAICGVFNLDGAPVQPGALDQPMNAMTHHGLDGSATWTKGPVTMGHLMTHVTPESLSERLPLHDAQAGLTLTADARLDNRDDLSAALGVPHAQRAGMPDSHLILLAYRKWGTHCPEHLLGDFAFALWDARQQQLFCARDILGVMPFLYHITGERFAFATEVKALLALEGVEPVLDMVTLAAELERNKSIHRTRTFYRDIAKLPPAHALVASSEGLRAWRYWDPAQAPDVRFATESQYVERLAGLLDKAVACRLRSAFPIGAHVSGGLDSTGVAVLASRALQAQGRTLAGGYAWSPPLAEEQEYLPDDERPRIQAVCEQEGIPLHYVTQAGADSVTALLRDISTQPTETLVRELTVSRMASQEGMRVMLSGWGGDEVVTHNGRRFYTEMFLRGRWATLYREARARGWGAFIKGKVILPLIPKAIIWALRPDLGRRPRQRADEAFYRFLDPAFARQLRQAQKKAAFRWPRWTTVRGTQLGLLNHGHITWRIESWASLGAERGLIYRYPLLDQRLLEFALGLPPELCVHDGWTRYLYRRAMEGVLPADIGWRRSKRDPALFDGAGPWSPDIYPLLAQALRERQARYPNQGFVDYEGIIEALDAVSRGEGQGPGGSQKIAVLNPDARLP